jgi:hypothetical protein
MFSFIKWVQVTLSRLQRHKGVWFTTLTTVSTLGILLSIYIINTMTSNVAHQTYLEERRVDVSQLDSLIFGYYDNLLNYGSIISINDELINGVKNRDSKKVNTLLNKITTTINNNANISPLGLRFYVKDYKIEGNQNYDIADMVIETQQSTSGIVVNRDGVRILGIVPVMENNVTIGALEVTQSIHVLKEEFEIRGKEFTFILSSPQLVFLDLEHKQGNYKKINDDFSVAFHKYDSSFYLNVSKLDFEILRHEKYFNDAQFYTTYDDVYDIHGNVIGMVLMGEDSDSSNSFVKITKNMINSVTTVALGLIISLILFMF